MPRPSRRGREARQSLEAAGGAKRRRQSGHSNNRGRIHQVEDARLPFLVVFLVARTWGLLGNRHGWRRGMVSVHPFACAVLLRRFSKRLRNAARQSPSSSRGCVRRIRAWRGRSLSSAAPEHIRARVRPRRGPLHRPRRNEGYGAPCVRLSVRRGRRRPCMALPIRFPSKRVHARLPRAMAGPGATR